MEFLKRELLFFSPSLNASASVGNSTDAQWSKFAHYLEKQVRQRKVSCSSTTLNTLQVACASSAIAYYMDQLLEKNQSSQQAWQQVVQYVQSMYSKGLCTI